MEIGQAPSDRRDLARTREFPSGWRSMYHHILVPLDRSAHSEAAIEAACHIAAGNDARVSLLTVIERLPTDPIHADTLDDQFKAQGRDYFDYLLSRVPASSFRPDVHVRLGLPTDEILHFAKEHRVDLIVMAAHGSGADLRYPMGSVTWKLLQRSPESILVVRPERRRST